MTISVLMSVYKSEHPAFMDRSLHSIWTDQTLKPDQIILIKDGPIGEDLQEVVDVWKERLEGKLLLHQNSENMGLTKSLNVGLQYVTSDLIARMDSDDISHPLRFERQVAFLQENPDIDVIGGSVQEFNQNNLNLGVRHYPSTPNLCKKSIVKANPLAHPSVMIRRRIFDAGFRYNEKYRNNQDLALWFDLITNGYKLANLPAVIVNFRRETTVYKRRHKFKSTFSEFKIYINGIYRLHGLFTFLYIYPVSRFIFRLMPIKIAEIMYSNSQLRNKVLK